jgi:dTDP-4-amino-4,6-dideoxygalactose transaminase
LNVPFMDLALGYRKDRAAMDDAVSRVLESGYWVGGPEVEAFESQWADHCGTAHAVGVGNGTDAITLALWAAGVEPGDEVILPALSAYPSAVGVMRSGAVPVFVDVNKADGLMDAAKTAEAVTAKTKAVVPVHLYGNACDMETLAALAKEKGLALVEDCAQAASVTLNGKKAGSWSAAASWSFYPTKNLGAVGDAGAVTTADGELADRLSRLRNYGQKDRYRHDEAGINTRLDPLQAAILSVKLEGLPARTSRRRQIAGIYDQALEKNKELRSVRVPVGCEPNRHLYPVFAEDEKSRDHWRQHLDKGGIATLIHYPLAMPDQEATPRESRGADVPVARELAQTEFSVPLFPEMTDEQVSQVAAALAA